MLYLLTPSEQPSILKSNLAAVPVLATSQNPAPHVPHATGVMLLFPDLSWLHPPDAQTSAIPLPPNPSCLSPSRSRGGIGSGRLEGCGRDSSLLLLLLERLSVRTVLSRVEPRQAGFALFLRLAAVYFTPNLKR